VVVSSETAGRLPGVERSEIGGSPRHLPDIVLGVVRNGHLLRVDAPEVFNIEAADRLLYVHNAGK
jgi:voltage-gated potassium channel